MVRVSLSKRGERLSHGEVIDALTKDSDFRQIYNKAIADAPYEALFWEWPPITLSTADRPNEYVLVRSPTLAGVRADPNAFAEHFTGPRAVTFENLG
ncbi:MAG: hypothetical protein GWN29_09490, partial [Gammaproteobacteria bacterium]|nr:hypothetical protein [Gammaproteobacteria bacterium]